MTSTKKGVKAEKTKQGTYTTIDGSRYFTIGKNRIKVTEHFLTDGKTITDFIQGVILFSAKIA